MYSVCPCQEEHWGGPTCGKDSGANHLVDVEEDNGEPPDVVSQGRMRLDGGAHGLLVGGPRAVPALDAGESEVAIVDDRRLRVRREAIGCIAVVVDSWWFGARPRPHPLGEGEAHVCWASGSRGVLGPGQWGKCGIGSGASAGRLCLIQMSMARVMHGVLGWLCAYPLSRKDHRDGHRHRT